MVGGCVHILLSVEVKTRNINAADLHPKKRNDYPCFGIRNHLDHGPDHPEGLGLVGILEVHWPYLPYLLVYQAVQLFNLKGMDSLWIGLKKKKKKKKRLLLI